MMKIKDFLFSLRGKAILVATFFIVIFMAITGYVILSREKALYLKDRENQARVLVEAAADYSVLLPQYADRNIITSMKF